jgi:hypothetical protein
LVRGEEIGPEGHQAIGGWTLSTGCRWKAIAGLRWSHQRNHHDRGRHDGTGRALRQGHSHVLVEDGGSRARLVQVGAASWWSRWRLEPKEAVWTTVPC